MRDDAARHLPSTRQPCRILLKLDRFCRGHLFSVPVQDCVAIAQERPCNRHEFLAPIIAIRWQAYFSARQHVLNEIRAINSVFRQTAGSEFCAVMI